MSFLYLVEKEVKKMSSTTTTTKPLYLSINKFCDRLWEMSKQDEKLVRVSLDKTYHLILDGKYMYDNKFNT